MSKSKPTPSTGQPSKPSLGNPPALEQQVRLQRARGFKKALARLPSDTADKLGL